MEGTGTPSREGCKVEAGLPGHTVCLWAPAHAWRSEGSSLVTGGSREDLGRWMQCQVEVGSPWKLWEIRGYLMQSP